MLDADSSAFEHSLQNVALLLLSIAFLPLDTFLTFWSLVFSYIIPSPVEQHRKANRDKASFKPRTILVTGVGMTKGLCLARLFYEAGHDVIGADFEANGITVCGRVSKALKKFIPLRKPTPKSGSAPYIQGLLDIITRESVDLWVSCSGVASAVEDGEVKQIIEARTACKAIQFDVQTTQTLHEKHTFIAHTQMLGLTVPETHTITNRAAVDTALHEAATTPKKQGRKYIMKTIGMVDTARGDMTLLPKATPAETARHLDRLDISVQSPWILQQFIRGREYCTHAVVVRGQVKAFLACPSAELLMHYEALPPDSGLSRAMLAFTQAFARAGGEAFTGHLSFDFLVEDADLDRLASDPAASVTLYPIECNPRAHTTVALFNGTTAMVDAYLSLLEPELESVSAQNANGTGVNGSSGDTDVEARGVVMPVHLDAKYYWVGHDFVNLILLPLLALVTLQKDSSLLSIVKGIDIFLDRLSFWKDGTYEFWDPLPWWWLYHVYWPMQFWHALRTDRRWSRLNVSTCKMFEC